MGSSEQELFIEEQRLAIRLESLESFPACNLSLFGGKMWDDRYYYYLLLLFFYFLQTALVKRVRTTATHAGRYNCRKIMTTAQDTAALLAAVSNVSNTWKYMITERESNTSVGNEATSVRREAKKNK